MRSSTHSIERCSKDCNIVLLHLASLLQAVHIWQIRIRSQSCIKPLTDIISLARNIRDYWKLNCSDRWESDFPSRAQHAEEAEYGDLGKHGVSEDGLVFDTAMKTFCDTDERGKLLSQ